MMLLPFLLFSAFTLVFNIITVVAIARKKIAPTYVKIKIGLVLNGIICLLVGLICSDSGHMNDYDFAWLIIYLLLIVWYAVIMATRPTPSKKQTLD